MNVVGYGTNHFPCGIEKKQERLERPLKYSLIEHAERDAIYDAAKSGKSTSGTIMYAPWFACADCGRAIIQAGISEVIGSTWPEKWWNESRDNSKENKKDWYASIKYAIPPLRNKKKIKPDILLALSFNSVFLSAVQQTFHRTSRYHLHPL